MDYTISYDPTSGTTTLINELDSAEDLPFWTQFGPDSGELLGVSPGSTATVDAAGDVSGPITKGGRCPNNKKADRSKDVTVKAVALCDSPGKVTIEVWPNPRGKPYTTTLSPTQSQPDSYTIPGGSWEHYEITTGKNVKTTTQTDAEVTSEESTTATYLSPNWMGDPSQTNMELVTGTLDVQDDTAAWTSIFTPTVITGCIPEPSTVVIWSLLGALGIATRWRRQRQAS